MKNLHKLQPFDFCLIALLVGAITYISLRIEDNLHYQWNWQIILQYLAYFDKQSDSWKINILLQGFLTTIRLSIWSSLLALMLGLIMGLFRVSRSLYLRLLGKTYVELIRNIPPIVLIFIFYFFFGDQILPAFGIQNNFMSSNSVWTSICRALYAPPEQLLSFTAAVITLGLFEGAYIAEIIRAGIQSIDQGQWEAGSALGFSRRQQMFYIILPQSLPLILPPLAGQFISTIKDSAIVSVISIQELTFQGMELMAATYLTFEIWITITALYFILTFTCSRLVAILEKRLSYARN